MDIGQYHQIFLVGSAMHRGQEVLELIALLRKKDLALAIIDEFLQIQPHLLGVAVIMHGVGYIQTHLFTKPEIMFCSQPGI